MAESQGDSMASYSEDAAAVSATLAVLTAATGR